MRRVSLRCPSVNNLFLRANGNFVCWDAAGSDTVLQEFSPDSDLACIRRRGGPCSETSRKLKEGRLPRPGSCAGCFCLETGTSPRFDPLRVEVMQVEPSAKCHLRCKACASENQRMALPPPLDLSPRVFEKVLEDFGESGIAIDCFDFSGHGEPLENPRLWELTSLARSFHPSSLIEVLTNGQGDFDGNILESGVDEIHVAIDGVDQESYSKYRVGGDFRKALNFLSGLAGASAGGDGPAVIWKYILFDHNDSPEQLRRAWEMAVDAEVSEIRFIFTSIGNWSENLRNTDDLGRLLSCIGVPHERVFLESRSQVTKRREWRELRGRVPGLDRPAKLLWRAVKRSRLESRLPAVTVDHCVIRVETMKEILRIGLRHMERGCCRDAADMLRHVEAMAEFPSRNNRHFDPQEFLRSLGETYVELKSSIPPDV